MPNVPLLSPGSVKGFISSQNAKALAPGFLSLIQNGRIANGLIEARLGDEQLDGVFTADCVGGYSIQLDDVPYLLACINESSEARFYISGDDGATWSEITSDAGPYGITRFQDDVNAPLNVCVVRDRGYEPDDAEYDLVVLQNGTEAPRIYGKAATNSSAFAPGTFGLAKVIQPDIPVFDENNPYFAGLDGGSFDIGAATSSLTNGTGITLSKDSSPNGQITCVVDNTYVANQYATAVFPSAEDFTGYPQLILMVLEATADFWHTVTLEIGDGTNWQPIVSQSLTGSNVYLEGTTPGGIVGTVFQIGIPLENLTGSVDLSAVDRIRFSWPITPVTTDQRGVLYMMANSGTTPGGAQYAAAYSGTDARTVGPSAVIAVQSNDTTKVYGGAQTPFFPILDSPLFYYRYGGSVKNPSTGQANDGIDRVQIYRRLPGEDQYYWIGSQQLTKWDDPTPNVWNFVSGSAGSYVTLDIPQGDSSIENQAVVEPGGDAVVMPEGKPMATANNRFFVGSGARLWFSDADFPFIFRKAVRFFAPNTPDGNSGGSNAFDGQSVQSLVPTGSFAGAAEDLSTPIAGATTLHVLTDSNLFLLSGFDATSLSRPIPVARYGTLSPMSVARSLNGFYWYDQTGQISYYGPQGIRRLSPSLVDNYTQDLYGPRVQWAWGACYNERYYFAFTQNGEASNTKALVWYERGDTWESVDTFLDGVETISLVPHYSSGSLGLYRFVTRSVYREEINQSVVDFKLRFGAFHFNGMQRASSKNIVVWVDGPVDGDYTITTKHIPNTGTPATGSIVVDAERVYMESPPAGVDAASVQHEISSDEMPGGNRVHTVFVQVDPVTPDTYRP